jgi:hypothetical protein
MAFNNYKVKQTSFLNWWYSINQTLVAFVPNPSHDSVSSFLIEAIIGDFGSWYGAFAVILKFDINITYDCTKIFIVYFLKLSN